MPGPNGGSILANSVQVTEQDPQLISTNVLPLSFFSTDGVAPCWDDGDRDWWLRYFWRKFGNDLLQAFLAVSVSKVVTQNFTIEGPEKKVEFSHRMMRDEYDFGKGYTHGLQRGIIDYYTQDNGMFIERRRSGPKDFEGPCLGLAHLDSQRMHPSGNDEFPYYYEDVEGSYHLMHRSQYIRLVDLPDSATEQYGQERGFCALSRALSTAMILSLLVTMKREKLSDLPPSAIAVFNNINRKQFENTLTLHGMQEDQKGNAVWRSVMPLFGIDPAHPATLDFISFREVWEGFEERTAWDIAAYSFAAAWRMDVREVWPASQGPLGSGKEAEVQHQKAKSKSTGLLFTSLERSFNSHWTLPADVNFKFQIQDAEEEAQRVAIHKEYISNVKTMQDAGATLSPEEVRYLLIQQKILPRGFEKPLVEGESLNVGTTPVYLDDTEQMASGAKEFWGPTVIIDAHGVKTYVEQGYYSIPSKEVMNADLDTEVLEMSKSIYMLADDKAKGDTIFDRIKTLPPARRTEVRKRARAMAEAMSSKNRMEYLLTGIPDEEWDAAVQADEQLEEGAKGGPGSGFRGHGGRPGQRGGSAPKSTSFSNSVIDEAVSFVDRLSSSGGDIGDINLSDDARAFLAQTVTKKSYNLYRGIGLVKGRISNERMREVRGMQSGDAVPEYLTKQGNPFASYTSKKSIAREFSEGKVSVIVQSKVPADNVVVDTRNLRNVMQDVGHEDAFDAGDYDYFKDVAEVLVQEPISGTILSVN